MYRLLKVTFGIKDLSTVFEGDLNFEINDICYVPNESGDQIVFSVTEDDQLGVFNNGKLQYPWHRGMQNLISRPSALTHARGYIYILTEDGKRVSSFEILNRTVVNYFDKRSQGMMDKMCSRIKSPCFGDIYADSSYRFYYVSDLLNRCFVLEGGELKTFAGNGKPNYSNSPDLLSCMFNSPRGITGAGKDSIFVSDTKNFCIRMLNKKQLKTVVGTPMVSGDEDGAGIKAKLIAPSRIVSSEQRLFFIDGGKKIKTFSLNDKNHNVTTQYNSEGEIVAIDPIDKRSLVILEKI